MFSNSIPVTTTIADEVAAEKLARAEKIARDKAAERKARNKRIRREEKPRNRASFRRMVFEAIETGEWDS